MRKLFLLTVLFTTVWLTNTAITCPDTPISSQTYTCGDSISRRTSATSLNLPSGQDSLTVEFDFRINSICGQSGALSFFALTITPFWSSEKKIASFTWTESSKQWNMYAQDSSSLKNIKSGTQTASTIGSWARGGVTIDLNNDNYGAAILFQEYRDEVTSTSLSFGSWWGFDSTTKLYFCGDIGGTNVKALACDIRNVVVYYNYFAPISGNPVGPRGFLVLGSTANQIAHYPFTEGTGYSTADTVGGVGTAYFGASTSSYSDTTNSPTWLSPGPGVYFSTTSQYVTVPVFTVQPMPRFTNTLSFGLSMWVQFTSNPSASNYIFRYYTTSSSTDRIIVQITNNQKLYIAFGGVTYTSSQTITLNRWNQFVISLTWNANTGSSTTNNYQGYISVTLGTTSWQAASTTGTKPVVSTSTDAVILGGFVGYLAHVQIFSYTAPIVNTNTASCSSTCSLDIGFSDPPVCLIPSSCSAGTFSSGDVCLNCDPTCPTCSSLTNCLTCITGYRRSGGLCVPCAAGTYPATSSSTTCTNCPSQCATCTSSTKCQTCSTGYYLSGTMCYACAAGTYAQTSTSTSCTNCPSECSACTDTSTCQKCITGYSLSGTMCYACSPGTYSASSSSTSCTNCPSQCATCTSSTKCQTCSPGYYLSGTMCYACSTGTYAATSTSTSCINCPSQCTACTGASTCQKCSTSYYLSGTSCDACSAGTYAATSTSTSCTTCATGCATCTAASTCQTCSKDYYKSGSKCYACSSGYYTATSTSTSCLACSTGCATCIDSSNCQVCKYFYSLNGAACVVLPCPQTNQYYDGSTCTNCHAGCATCNGASTCQSCDTGYYLSSSMCYACAPGTFAETYISSSCTNCPTGCASCTDLDTCQSCSSGYTLSGTTCNPNPCPLTNQYRTGATCTNCNTGCATCTDGSTCQTCDTGYYLSGAMCYACPAATFAETSTSTSCTNCPGECASCTDSSTCQSCISGYTLSGITCNPDPCPDPKQYRTVDGCVDCAAGCTTCTDANTCQTCDANYYLQGITCISCPAGTYSASSSTFCIDCPYRCATCTDSTTCQTCRKGYSLDETVCIMELQMSASNPEGSDGMIILAFIVGGTTVLAVTAFIINKIRIARMARKITNLKDSKLPNPKAAGFSRITPIPPSPTTLSPSQKSNFRAESRDDSPL